jgi:DNA-binding NtrC family response regulator
MATVSELQDSEADRYSKVMSAKSWSGEEPILRGLIGDAPSFRAMKQHIRRIASADAPVLIEGETGSGKELAARAVHYLSERRHRPFVPLNCGAIPEHLIESELFGHVRGAFTDAKQARPGVISQAGGGTLFLDEIDSLPAKAQVVLLRFLQDHRYRAIGNDREQVSDVRIIAASNRPLRELVGKGAFRSDLLYRLDILSLQIPPLRERLDDLPMLGRHFLEHYCAQYDLPLKRFHPSTMRWMHGHDWPGNVRELENLVHRLVLMSDGEQILHAGGNGSTADDEGIAAQVQGEQTRPYPSFRRAKALAVASFERRYLAELMAQTRGNVSAAARLANKERRALGKLLRKHGIDRQTFQD